MPGSRSGYFDHNATAPLSAAARDAWLEAAGRHWHNPSGLYRDAAAAKVALEDAREQLADLIGVDEPERIVFNSGATEGNNAVVSSLSRHRSPGGATAPGLALVSPVEHPSVAAPVARWCGDGAVRRLPVSPDGAVEASAVAGLLEESGPALVSVMAANNETGVLQPWREIAEACAAAGVPYHCDAVQWLGRLPCDGFGACSFVTGSAHKCGGPKGTGFLVVPASGADRFAAQSGGPQENGRRAGTEDVAGILAMVAALAAAEPADPAGRDEFERLVVERVPGAAVLGQAAPRLANTSLIALPAHKNTKWLTRLDRLGFQVSTGSACSAGRGNPSAVLEAMGLGYGEMGRVLRFSGGGETTGADWRALAAAVGEVWADLKSPAGGAAPSHKTGIGSGGW